MYILLIDLFVSSLRFGAKRTHLEQHNLIIKNRLIKMDYEIRDQLKPTTVTSSLYGTLPRRGKRARKAQKKSPEEMAIMLAQYAVYQAEKVRSQKTTMEKVILDID